MPVQIGAKAHSFPDPTGLLSDCHRRIEMFLKSLQQVAEIIDRPLTEEARSALESALRYFRESAPKHTADEEESLFPRLRQSHDPKMEAALQTLNGLESDHREAEALHADDTKEKLAQLYQHVEYVGTSADNPYAAERNIDVFFCRGPKFGTLADIWPSLKHWR